MEASDDLVNLVATTQFGKQREPYYTPPKQRYLVSRYCSNP
jgi:hypothetical protein